MKIDNTDYILFLDESNVTKFNPYLLLGGIFISRKEYKDNLIPNILKCKSILENPNIIFHYTDMIKKQNDFSCMCGNQDMCEKFWNEFYSSLTSSKFKILSAYINAKNYNSEYPKSISHDAYELLFSTIVNNYIHFLNKNNARGSIIFESREETQNKKNQQYYFHMLKYGTNIYHSTAIEKYITTTNFLVKEDNCIGLQIADLVAYNCIKYLNNSKVKHNMLDVIIPKMYDGNKGDIESYGIIKLF